jgi:hypothetical protein
MSNLVVKVKYPTPNLIVTLRKNPSNTTNVCDRLSILIHYLSWQEAKELPKKKNKKTIIPRSFRCESCSSSFLTEVALRNHIMARHGTKMNKYASFSFSSTESVRSNFVKKGMD